MNRRALVIGSQTRELRGVHNDVAMFSPRIRSRNFEVREQTEDRATCEAIKAGIEWLIRDSGPEDAALIYFSGHGVEILNPRHAESGQPSRYRCLVPTDWGKAGFHGLLDIELSVLLARLTAVTENVALILDCCHSARMWRGPEDAEAVAKALDPVDVEGFADYLEQIDALDRSLLHAERNPHAVRLLACEADQSAYERTLIFEGETRRMGVMTAVLCERLDELEGTPVSWHALTMLVREEVMRRCADQRPQLEGPGRRYLFERGVAEHGGAVVYLRADGRHALRANRLLGAERGGRYAIMGPGVSTYDPDRVAAEATVSSLTGTLAYIDPEPANAALREGSLAYPMLAPLARHAVRVTGNEAATAAMRESIQSSRFARVAELEDAAVVDLVHDGQLHLLRNGVHVATPTADDESGRRLTLARIEDWARAETLRNMSGHGPRPAFEVEWGRVEQGRRIAMRTGETFHVEDCLYVEMRNRSDVRLLFSVIDIGVKGTVTLLTGEQTGTIVEPGESYTLGFELGSQGLACGWPEDVPRERPLPESLLVIAATERHDMSSLETGVRSSSREPQTELGQLLEQLGGGGARDFKKPRKHESGSYSIERIDFVTSPQRRVEFCVTELPTPRLLDLVTLKPEPPPSEELALRLTQLKIHDNRALWGKADLRVGAVCVTGGRDGVVTFSQVFRGIRQGDSLPIGKLRLFQAPVVGFLDFALWVGKAESNRKDLAELVRDLSHEEEFQQATTVLAGLTMTGPHAATLAAAMAAGGTVVYFVNKVIQHGLGRHIGLYRTSFLGRENWGIGRHPESGLRRAQDFSFAYEIVSTRSR